MSFDPNTCTFTCPDNMTDGEVWREILKKVCEMANATTNPAPVIRTDVEFICNEDTNLYDRVETTTTDGVITSIVTVATTTPCSEQALRVDVEYVCNTITGNYDRIEHTYDEDGNLVSAVTTDTGSPCVRNTRESDEHAICYSTDGGLTQSSGWLRFIKDSQAVIVGTEIVDDAGAVVAGAVKVNCEVADVVTVDVEYICDETLNTWQRKEITKTNGTITNIATIDTGVSCDDQEPREDVEYICNPVTGNYDKVVIIFDEDGTEVSTTKTDTGDPCVRPTFKTDEEKICYSTDGGVTTLKGYRSFRKDDQGNITTSSIIDQAGTVVAGAVEVDCPCCPQVEREQGCFIVDGEVYTGWLYESIDPNSLAVVSTKVKDAATGQEWLDSFTVIPCCEKENVNIPFARLTAITCVSSVEGTVEITTELKEMDDLTALVSPDTVTLEVYDITTGSVLIETISAVVGNDWSTGTTDHPTPADSVLNFISGTVQDAGTLSFDSADWGTQNGVYDAILGQNTIDLQFVIKAIEVDGGYESSNADNFIDIIVCPSVAPATPPFGRVTGFTNDNTNLDGRSTQDFEFHQSDDATPIDANYDVVIEIYNDIFPNPANLLASAQFNFGDDIVTGTPVGGTDNNWTSNVQPHILASSTVQDGMTMTLFKKAFASQWHTDNGGELMGWTDFGGGFIFGNGAVLYVRVKTIDTVNALTSTGGFSEYGAIQTYTMVNTMAIEPIVVGANFGYTNRSIYRSTADVRGVNPTIERSVNGGGFTALSNIGLLDGGYRFNETVAPATPFDYEARALTIPNTLYPLQTPMFLNETGAKWDGTNLTSMSGASNHPLFCLPHDESNAQIELYEQGQADFGAPTNFINGIGCAGVVAGGGLKACLAQPYTALVPGLNSFHSEFSNSGTVLAYNDFIIEVTTY